MSYCQYCSNCLEYPLERREKLCSTHLYLDGSYADKMIITKQGYIIPKPEYLPLNTYYPFVWRFALIIGTAIIGIILAAE